MEKLNKSDGFRVIIAGGGIAGLTLANTLQHAGIDYILLEARKEISPEVSQVKMKTSKSKTDYLISRWVPRSDFSHTAYAFSTNWAVTTILKH